LKASGVIAAAVCNSGISLCDGCCETVNTVRFGVGPATFLLQKMEKIGSTSKVLIPKPSNSKLDSGRVVYGEYTAGGTVCTESAINNVVARVHLDPRSLNEYLGNKTKGVELVSEVKKGIKRKLQESSTSDKDGTNNVEVQIKKRGRGRPRKIQENVVTDKKDVKIQENVVTDKKDVDLKTDVIPIVRKRGRPRKIIANAEDSRNTNFKTKLKSNFESLKVKKDLFKMQRFNGGKNTGIVTTTRVRKPNSKFQDFIVSPNIRNFAPSSPDSDPKEKPLPVKVKPKPKPSKQEETTNTVAEDPLALSNSDDVVHSFLPVFDEPPRFDNVLILKNKSSKATEQSPNVANKIFKEKENQVNNVQPKIKKDTPKLELQESDKGDYSPPKLRSRSNSKLSTPQLPVIKSPKIKVVDKEYKQPLKKIEAVTSDSVTPQKKPKVKYGENGVEKPAAAKQPDVVAVKQSDVVKVTHNTLKNKTKVNGSNQPIKQKRNVRYVLIECNSSPHRTKVPKFSDVDFNKLVRSLKSVKLPAANWKIRIVVSRQQTITEVTFTNKEVNERCVKFSRVFTGYVITFGKSVVKLLGAPSKISSFNDVTVLLDIIHNVSSNDPVLEYSADNNV